MDEFITVSQLNDYIAGLLDEDVFLQNCWLKAEISGFKLYRQSGHMYFTLKDEESSISCVMFKSRNRCLEFMPEDGQEVLVRGRVSVFAKQGKYQLYVEEMQPYGVGGLFLYLQQLKVRLTEEGYFNKNQKKSLPTMAHRVGVITSQDGAALRDIVRVLKSRHPGVEIVLAHSMVQGEEAPQALAEAIRLMNRYQNVDVIIIGRGGGSFEDLMAFNSEEVVIAIAESALPIISAVGHEADFSLADLAADVRAATPTQAAQIAVPDMGMLRREVNTMQQRMIKAVTRIYDNCSESLDRMMMRRIWKEPAVMVAERQDRFDRLKKALIDNMQDMAKNKEGEYRLAVTGLDSRSPLKVMQRGYVFLKKGNKIINQEVDIVPGDEVTIAMLDADLTAEIKQKEKITRWKI